MRNVFVHFAHCTMFLLRGILLQERVIAMNSEKVKFDKVAYNNSFIAKAYDRINLTVPKGSKDAIKAHAESHGESVNGFINRAIMKVTEMDNMHRAYQRGLLRQLNQQKEALQSKDYGAAEKLLDRLIEDTKADIEE